MKTFPMFLKTSGKRIVILGGGETAAQKCRLALKTDATLVVAAPALDLELAGLAATGRIEHHRGPITPALFEGAALVFAATGCRGADAGVAALAKAAGAVVNVVDAPELCDAFTPSIVDRDPLVVAIGTEGAAPVLARQVKTKLEEILEPRLGDFVALAGRLRDAVAQRVPQKKRRAFWRWVFAEAPRRAHAQGRERDAAKLLKEAIEAGGAPDGAIAAGMVSLVGAGPGARDLITLRGVQRLQEADVVFYDRLIDTEVLELARRDAERIYVGKTPGAADWPQDRINAVIVAAAKQGKRVVRLKCGDPGVFARGAEEAAALDAAGLSWEIVPGVTAASAAASELGRFLTERDAVDTLVLTTGHASRDGTPPRWSEQLKPGVTMAIYMGVGAAPEIQAELLGAGLPEGLEVEVVSRAGSPDAQMLRATLGDMARAVAVSGVANPAIILVRRPKPVSLSLSRRAAPRAVAS
ncbi:MAG: siroheme synthase CysG [Pseudomonadota bacterium]